MDHHTIIGIVNKTIDSLIESFKAESTRFYTENDLVCFYYSLLQQRLKDLKAETQKDSDGYVHHLIHSEYPTPFRCDMQNKRCVIKTDTDLTPNGKKFKRGHYDIVVMNPFFISQYPYHTIKAQDYNLFNTLIKSKLSEINPVILYGIEFMFKRDPLKWSRGSDKKKAVKQYVAEVLQDADKLLHGKNKPGFMAEVKMLVFVKGTNEEIQNYIMHTLEQNLEILVVFAD
jgi:hypothetical protein